LLRRGLRARARVRVRLKAHGALPVNRNRNRYELVVNLRLLAHKRARPRAERLECAAHPHQCADDLLVQGTIAGADHGSRHWDASACACACACVVFAFVAFAFVAQVCTEKKANAKLATFANTRARTTHRCLRVARTRPLASSCAEAHAPCGSTAARVRSRATVPGGSLPRPVPSPRPCARRTSPSSDRQPRRRPSGASPSSPPRCK
jgi:hypothetical protein